MLKEKPPVNDVPIRLMLRSCFNAQPSLNLNLDCSYRACRTHANEKANSPEKANLIRGKKDFCAFAKLKRVVACGISACCKKAFRLS